MTMKYGGHTCLSNRVFFLAGFINAMSYIKTFGSTQLMTVVSKEGFSLCQLFKTFYCILTIPGGVMMSNLLFNMCKYYAPWIFHAQIKTWFFLSLMEKNQNCLPFLWLYWFRFLCVPYCLIANILNMLVLWLVIVRQDDSPELSTFYINVGHKHNMFLFP